MARSALAEELVAIYRDALEASHAGKAVEARLQVSSGAIRAGRRAIALDRVERVGVVAVGKAAPAMAEAVPEPIKKKMTFGVIVTKEGYSRAVPGFQIREAGHPVPDRSSVRAADEVVELVSELGEEDLLLVLISGGASSLLFAPVADVGFNDGVALVELMLRSGMDVTAINSVRSHLSRIKGGRLAVIAAPASVLTLALSDVVGEDKKLPVIGGGPTVADPSRYKDAIAGLQKARIYERVPESVKKYLEAGNRGEIPESPKPGDPRLSRAFAAVVGGPRTLLRAAARSARSKGLRVRCATRPIEGPVEELVEKYMARAGSMVRSGTGREVFVAVGEPTVKIPHELIDAGQLGKGGRNQHLALLMAQAMAGDDHMAFLSAGTDGTDGPTPAAGGVVDGGTIALLTSQGIDVADALRRFDSFTALGTAPDCRIQTGPTDTNVTDLHLLAVEGKTSAGRKKRV
jgi:hydroxypyruvate reductase